MATRHRTPPFRIIRVSQLDAELLDSELLVLLKDQLHDMLSLFSPSIKQSFDPEFTLLLQVILYSLSIFPNNTSYGLSLQNLKYRDERAHGHPFEYADIDVPPSTGQKVLWGVFNVGGEWAWKRLNDGMVKWGWSELDETDYRYKIWKHSQKIEKYFKLFSLLNFFVFLYNGKYRSLTDRILRMRLVYLQRNMNRQVNFAFLNRQLVWNAFTEFLLFLLPLLSLPTLQRRILRFLPFTSPHRSRLSKLHPETCAICVANSPQKFKCTIPYITDCNHLYCYYCVRVKMMSDKDWECLRCGKRVQTVKKRKMEK
ncbi:Pex12 amino terminal region-domain-containing protein [Paraphysoderma sedebokerense]|nr:Pex12 amino terminal region-domain-containing protein [Paraphysoderma sedebokerense]